jgi:cysteine desulfurase / selenocysteine lyase
MGVAVDYALGLGMDAIWSCVREQAALLRSRLAKVLEVTIRDLGKVRGGIVAFTVDGLVAAVAEMSASSY